MIRLDSSNIREIHQHGEKDYPYECCGLLLGKFADSQLKVVTNIYPISNAREEEAKRTRFLITAEELMRGERFARQHGLEVIGFYHSHPEHPAVPSAYDRDHALPVYSYIVLSVRNGKAEELRSWELSAETSVFEEEEILKGS